MSISANQFGALLFGDLFPVPVLSVTEDKYQQALQTFIAAENAMLQDVVALLADTGTDVQTGFTTNLGGRLQKTSELGGTEATKVGKRWYTGYPIDSWGDRALYSVPWLDQAPFWQLAESILNATLKDIDTYINEVLKAVLYSVNYTFDDTVWPGQNTVNNVGVRRLANADGNTGSVYAHGQEIVLASLNHYLVSGAADPTVDAFFQARAALRNVGHDSDIVYVVSRSTAEYCARHLTPDFVLPTELLQTDFRDPVGKYGLVQSPRARGRVAFGEVIEWPSFPDGYMLALDRSKEKPVRIRQHQLAKYQGFQLANDDDVPNASTHPLVNKHWRRIFGCGVRNRVNGVVIQFTTNGSYTDPDLG